MVGNKVHFLLLGGNAVNANALLRFYVLHAMILPLALMFFVAIHFWRIRKDGGLYNHDSEPPVVRAAGNPSSGNIDLKCSIPVGFSKSEEED